MNKYTNFKSIELVKLSRYGTISFKTVHGRAGNSYKNKIERVLVISDPRLNNVSCRLAIFMVPYRSTYSASVH